MLFYKREEGVIKKQYRTCTLNLMSAGEFFDESAFLIANKKFNIITAQRCGNSFQNFVDGYHLGEFVSRFRDDSLCMVGSDTIKRVIFGTANGAIGFIASLPGDRYSFVDKLQSNLRKVIEGVGKLDHEQWRSPSKNNPHILPFIAVPLVDGDLIESFLDLNESQMDEISKAMSVSVEELCKSVHQLAISFQLF